MATRSTTSMYQPIPPNYALGTTGAYHNVGRYAAINGAATPHSKGPNMCTAPVVGNTQFQYVPRVTG